VRRDFFSMDLVSSSGRSVAVRAGKAGAHSIHIRQTATRVHEVPEA